MKNNPIKNLKIFSALVLCLAFVVISGCKNAASDDSGSTASKSSENKIIEFGFKKADNAVLSGDVKAVIDNVNTIGNVIAVKFPAGTSLGSLTNLKPYFSVSGGVKLYFGSTMLESGITELDFSNIWNGDNYVITAKAEDGGAITFKCFSEIAFPAPSTTEIEKYQGSYYGKVPGRGDVIIVIEKAKVTVYSKAMSVDYENVEWTKNPDNSISCRTYNKGKEKVRPFMLNSHYFTDSYESGGNTYPAKVSASIMETFIFANKGTDFTWTEGSGYKAVGMHS